MSKISNLEIIIYAMIIAAIGGWLIMNVTYIIWSAIEVRRRRKWKQYKTMRHIRTIR